MRRGEEMIGKALDRAFTRIQSTGFSPRLDCVASVIRRRVDEGGSAKQRTPAVPLMEAAMVGGDKYQLWYPTSLPINFHDGK